MCLTLREYIEAINSHCYAQKPYYQFNTSTLVVADEYRAGRIKALEYVQELAFDYLQKEKRLKEEFRQQLIAQMKEHARLMPETEYKRGLYDALNDVLNSQINT